MDPATREHVAASESDRQRAEAEPADRFQAEPRVREPEELLYRQNV